MNATVLTGSCSPRGGVPSSNQTYPAQVRRGKLLTLIDNLVHVSNSADFNSLLSILALACCEAVTVVTCLQALPSTNNRISLDVLTADHRTTPYITQESSAQSIALVWIILYCAHPDGVMKIVDKRICYRIALRQPANVLESASQRTSTSVLETVVTLCGSSIVQQSLQELLIQAEMNNSTAANVTHDTVDADRTATAHSGATAEKIHLITLLLSSRAASKPSTNADGVEGKRWRYLIEFRLQFDEHDLVTHWTTTMLAAEPEEILLKPQLRL
jgi:hypothetical protein